MEKYLNNIDLILKALKINYNRTSGRVFFPCPIHGSDNYNSLSIYTNSGKWRCFTRHCENEYGDNLFSFISAVLKCDKKQGEEFCNQVLEGLSPEVVNRKVVEKKREKFKPIPRKEILSFVNPNIPFYLRRGYSKEILEKYDLFICNDRSNQLYGRVVIPVYDDNRINIIGFLGRSLSPKCKKCGTFHQKYESCPQLPYDFIRFAKWRNSKGFARSHSLFNFWFAKEEIERTKTLILVESPGNVIKIAQAGINNVVGVFGTEITKQQIEKIHSLKPDKILCGFDNDSAGKKALEKISEKLSMYNIIPFIPPVNDFGEMSTEDIKSLYLSTI